MIATKDFYEAVGYLLYALAASDEEGVEPDELKKLGRLMLNKFGPDMETKGMRAIARFEMLADKKESPEIAYSTCVEKFADSKPELKQFAPRIVEVLEELAASDSEYTGIEHSYIERFKDDSTRIIA